MRETRFVVRSGRIAENRMQVNLPAGKITALIADFERRGMIFTVATDEPWPLKKRGRKNLAPSRIQGKRRGSSQFWRAW